MVNITRNVSTGQAVIGGYAPSVSLEAAVPLAAIPDPDFRSAAWVDVLDGFAVFVEQDSGRFFCSDYLDATSYDPLGFATAEGFPDDLVSLLVDHRQLLLFGKTTTEVWYNAGTSGPIPFQREQNGLIECGCGAAASPAKADNSVVWLDEKRIARKLADLTPQRISTHAVEQAWQTYDDVSDAVGLSFTHEGHWFYVLNFPSAGATWAWDAATGEWHERSSRYDDGSEGAWRAQSVLFCYGENIVADTESGQLGKIRADAYTDWDETQIMSWTYPNVFGGSRKAFHRRLEIHLESGVGLVSGQGSEPAVLLYVSDNGGRTFKPVQNRSFGRMGEYRKRISWWRLGAAYDRVYRASVSDPVPVTVWDTNLEIENGRL